MIDNGVTKLEEENQSEGFRMRGGGVLASAEKRNLASDFTQSVVPGIRPL